MHLLFALFFSGTFMGSGKALFASGKTYQCREIFLQIKSTPSDFKLSEGGYKCEDLEASFDPFRFSIVKGDLVHENRVYGNISQDILEYRMYDGSDDSTYHLKLQRISSYEFSYLEEWFDGDKLALTIQGALKTKTPYLKAPFL